MRGVRYDTKREGVRVLMANLPMDRTKLNAAITNQQPSVVASSQANREALVETADTIDLLNQKVDSNIAAGALAPYPPSFLSRQAIINGNFDVWQRGTSFNITGSPFTLYGADRWRESVNADGGTLPALTVTRQQLTAGDIPNSFYFHRITTDGAGSALGNSSNYTTEQPIENGTRLLCGLGKSVTVSFWARSSIPGKKLAINIVQEYGTGGTPSASEQLVGETFTLTNEWKSYTVTFVTNTLIGKTFGTNNNDILRMRFWNQWGVNFITRLNAASAESFVGAGDIDIAQVKVNAGDAELPFPPRSFAEELALCQRYYEKSLRLAVVPGSAADQSGLCVAQASNTSELFASIIFQVAKRITPTITLYSYNGTASKVAAVGTSADVGTTVTASAANIGDHGFAKIVDSGAGFTAGTSYWFHYVADAEL